MANETGLKIVMSADVSNALAGFSKVSAEAGKTGAFIDQSFSGISRSVAGIGSSLAPVSAAFGALGTSAKQLSTDVGGLGAAANAIKVFNAAAGQLPIASIETYRRSVVQLRNDLAGGFKPVIVADFDAAANSAVRAGQVIEQSFEASSVAAIQLGNTVENITSSFTGVVASAGAINNIGVAINGITAEATQGAAAIQAMGTAAVSLGPAASSIQAFNAAAQQLPLAPIENYRRAVELLRNDLAGGFKPIVATGFDEATAAANKTGQAIQMSFNGASASASQLSNTIQGITTSFNGVVASSGAISKISAGINGISSTASQGASAISGLGSAAVSLSSAAVAFKVFNANASQLPLQPIENYRRAVQQLQQEVGQGLSTPRMFVGSADAINKTSSALKGVKPAAGQAGAALNDVSRIAQDLPFGLIGIQNNINPLLESFQRLRASTGSAGGAFKALAGSLFGAGGIGLAVSAVSAAFVIYQNGIAGFNRKTKEAKAATDEYKETLRGVSAEIANQASNVTKLVSALGDANTPLTERTEALKQLKSINSDYFGALKIEGDTINGLTNAYKAYLSELGKLARAKAIEEQITKLFSKKIELELSIDPKFSSAVSPETQRRLGSLRDQLEALGGAVDVTKTNDKNLFEDGNQNLRERLKLQRQISELEKGSSFFQGVEYQQTVRQIDDIGLKIRGLQQLQEDTGVKIKVPEIKVPKGSEKDPVLEALKTELAGYQKELTRTNRLREEGLLPLFRENDALELQLKIYEQLQKIDQREVDTKVKANLEIDPVINDLDVQKALRDYSIRSAEPITIPIAIIPELNIDTSISIPKNIIPEGAFDAIIDRMEREGLAAADKLKSISLDIAEEINAGVGAAADAVGQGIGDILSGFGGGSLIAGFANVLADILSQIGKLLIKTGVQILGLQELVLKIAATPAGAAAAIAGGVAAVALAAILKNSVRNIKPRPFATGGLVNGPTLGLLGEAGPEVVLPLDRLPALLNATQGTNVNLTGKLAIEGRRLVAFIEQEKRAYTRING